MLTQSMGMCVFKGEKGGMGGNNGSVHHSQACHVEFHRSRTVLRGSSMTTDGQCSLRSWGLCLCF